ncbi:hypothetical protein PAEPH01_0745 [Pancytospora epiphaga]|nr:hypothetical protein PAEPH01_0745 [Pancytospora epiphaga]
MRWCPNKKEYLFPISLVNIKLTIKTNRGGDVNKTLFFARSIFNKKLPRMVSIFRSSLITFTLISFIIAYGIHIRASNQQLFHTINIIGIILGLLFNKRKKGACVHNYLKAFPFALMDYFYIFAVFSSFGSDSILEVIMELIFRNTALLFFTSGGLSMTSIFIYIFMFISFHIYKGMLSIIRLPGDEIRELVLLSVTILRSMVVMAQSSPISFERFFSLFLIGLFGALFNYKTTYKEISFIIKHIFKDSEYRIPGILSFLFYSIFISLIVLAKEFKSRDFAIFSVFGLCGGVMLYTIGFSRPYIWDYGIYSVAPRVLVLLSLIAVNFICLSFIKIKHSHMYIVINGAENETTGNPNRFFPLTNLNNTTQIDSGSTAEENNGNPENS